MSRGSKVSSRLVSVAARFALTLKSGAGIARDNCFYDDFGCEGNIRQMNDHSIAELSEIRGVSVLTHPLSTMQRMRTQ